MLPEQPARLLRIHISESDRYQGKPLYEAIVHKCREMKIAGATVFRGLEGYGETAEMHKSHLIRKDQPIVISIIDTPQNLARLVPVVEEMMDTGLIALSDRQSCSRSEKGSRAGWEQLIGAQLTSVSSRSQAAGTRSMR